MIRRRGMTSAGPAPDVTTQGAIWKTIVEPEIRMCDRLMAFVDLPNANVGFEVGYGLGLGKPVALARVKPSLAPWLSEPPLNGFHCPQLQNPKDIRKAVELPAEKWFRLAGETVADRSSHALPGCDRRRLSGEASASP